MRIAPATALSFLTIASFATAAPPRELTATPVPNKLDLVTNDYDLQWQSDQRIRYRVLVASDGRKLAADVGDLWDSGVRFALGAGRIRYSGKALVPGSTAYWKVRTWGAEGAADEGWSAPAAIAVPGMEAPVQREPQPHPTNHGGGELAFTEGRLGKALATGPGMTSVRAEDYPGLRSTEGVTIAAWVKPTNLSNWWQCIYRQEAGDRRRLLALGQEGRAWGLWCGLHIGGRYVEEVAPYDKAKLQDGEWHHVAASYDGSAIRFYIDGEKVHEHPIEGELGAGIAPGFIGSYNGDGEIFHGAIDDLRIYTTAINADAMASLASGESEVEVEAIGAHWKFDGSLDNEVKHLAAAKPPPQNRIAFLGGTLVADMERYGYLEQTITANWPHHDITFRNIGWPADDVFGTARSEFGSAQNTRSWKPPGVEPGFGYGELMRHIDEAAPTTLIVGYGAETAFLETEAQWEDWRKGFGRLMADIEKRVANVLLMTPVRHEKHGEILPDPAAHNRRLERTAMFLKSYAEEHGLVVIDNYSRLFGAWSRSSGTNPAYSDGIHLNALGHSSLAIFMAIDLSVPPGDYALFYAEGNGREWVRSEDGKTHTSVRVGGEHPSWMTVSYGTATGQTSTKRGFRLDVRLDRLPGFGGTGYVRSPFYDEGEEGEGPPFAVRINGELVGGQGGRSVAIHGGPDHDQSAELRRQIVEKNRFYRYKLRPINKAYIFLFRRHEMGHLAYEMEDFDELIAGRERAIAHLRVPRTHGYEIDQIEPWKTPRDYPDHEVPKDMPEPDVESELAAFEVAGGFQVNLFAKDPWIANPINLNWDRRGRAWVSTSSTYPHIKPGRTPDDRIVILEDIDRDGVADKHIVFAEGLTVPHSVMPVDGGAYVCSTTEYLFLPDRDGDDRADSVEVVYSGFGNADVHHMIHGQRWAPWGELHFIQSIYINSFVDTPHGPRRMNGSGIWRFRPETRELDALAVGMVNPWGYALDRWGQGFGTDGAGGAGPHYVFPGAAFPSAVGQHRVLSGLVPGKPKNTAAEFVSGRHMPERWHGSLLANDFRANRTVRYEIKASGSGYTAEEVETVLQSSHRSFRPVDIKMGPDGAIYVVDWYNAIIDHGEVDFHHPLRDKSHGRIWRITAEGRPTLAPPDVVGASDAELLDMLKAPEQYTRTQANRELVRRPCQGQAKTVLDWVAALDDAAPDYDRYRLEALWALMGNRIGDGDLLRDLLRSADHRVRAAAVRAVSNWRSRTSVIDRPQLIADAIGDNHPQVRLEAINAARAMETVEGASIALRALDMERDNNINFALELAVRALRDVWLPALEAGREVFDGDPAHLDYALREADDPRVVGRLLEKVLESELQGGALANAIRTVAALGEPEHLDALIAQSPGLGRLPAIADGARFNSNKPTDPSMLLTQLGTKHGKAAAQLCAHWRIAESVEPLARLLRERDSADAAFALARLGAFEHLKAKGTAVAIAAWATAQPRKALPAALADLSEPIFAAYLSHADGPAILAEGLAGRKIDADVAKAGTRLAHASGRDVGALVAALNAAGELPPVGAVLSAAQRRELLADAAAKGDIARGREVYTRGALLCATCHTIAGEGGQLGPDLTTVGTYMTPESLLESLLNPSTDIKQGYETVVITTKDDTVITGLLQRKTGTAHLIRDPGGTVRQVPNGDIAKIDSSPASLMPPGLTAGLRRDELVDLMSYLTTLGK